VTLRAASNEEDEETESPESADAAPYARAPALHAAFYLRSTAILSVVAAVFGLVVAPGLRGIARDGVVAPMNRFAWALAYAMCGLVVTTIVLAAIELARASRIAVGARGAVIGAAGAVVALSAPSLARTLPSGLAIALALSAVIVSLISASVSLSRAHTRAVGMVLLAFAFAALARVVSWEVAKRAGDASSVRLYQVSQWIATAAVVSEGLGQMFAAAWLGTRSRFLGQALAAAAVAGAFLLTWNAARGSTDFAAPWQAALHVALGRSSGLPAPLGSSVFPVFLVVASILLALVAAVQPRPAAAVVFALSLGLLGRGSFDVPLRALSATAGALWLMIAGIDDRALWHSRMGSRQESHAR
jgi:hypothetical protein